MLYTRSITLFIVVTVFVSITACDLFERRDRTYDLGPKLEFFPLRETVDEADVAAQGGSMTLNPEIQLIGQQRESDLTVNVTVADSSSAVEGTHYQLSSTSVTIPSGSSQVDLPVTVLDNDQDDGDQTHSLFLNIQGSGDVEPAGNLRTFTLNLRGADE